MIGVFFVVSGELLGWVAVSVFEVDKLIREGVEFCCGGDDVVVL